MKFDNRFNLIYTTHQRESSFTIVKPDAEGFHIIEIQEMAPFTVQQANKGSKKHSGNKRVFIKRSIFLKWTPTGRRFE
jgi:hypothetical protein